MPLVISCPWMHHSQQLLELCMHLFICCSWLCHRQQLPWVVHAVFHVLRMVVPQAAARGSDHASDSSMRDGPKEASSSQEGSRALAEAPAGPQQMAVPTSSQLPESRSSRVRTPKAPSCADTEAASMQASAGLFAAALPILFDSASGPMR